MTKCRCLNLEKCERDVNEKKLSRESLPGTITKTTAMNEKNAISTKEDSITIPLGCTRDIVVDPIAFSGGSTKYCGNNSPTLQRDGIEKLWESWGWYWIDI
jgi:hypothetical protein